MESVAIDDCVDVVVLVRGPGINGIMDNFPSQPNFMWILPTYTNVMSEVGRVVTAINSVECVRVLTSKLYTSRLTEIIDWREVRMITW